MDEKDGAAWHSGLLSIRAVEARVSFPDFLGTGVVVDGKGVGERVVLMDVVAEGRGVIARVGWAGFRVEGDESRGILLKGTDDGGDLFGPGEVVVVDEFHGGGVVRREVEGESGVIEEELGRVGALGEPLEFAEFFGVSEGGAADG